MIYTIILNAMLERKISINKLSIATGIPYTTLKDNLHRVRKMTVDNLELILTYLDGQVIIPSKKTKLDA